MQRDLVWAQMCQTKIQKERVLQKAISECFLHEKKFVRRLEHQAKKERILVQNQKQKVLAKFCAAKKLLTLICSNDKIQVQKTFRNLLTQTKLDLESLLELSPSLDNNANIPFNDFKTKDDSLCYTKQIDLDLKHEKMRLQKIFDLKRTKLRAIKAQISNEGVFDNKDDFNHFKCVLQRHLKIQGARHLHEDQLVNELRQFFNESKPKLIEKINFCKKMRTAESVAKADIEEFKIHAKLQLKQLKEEKQKQKQKALWMQQQKDSLESGNQRKRILNKTLAVQKMELFLATKTRQKLNKISNAYEKILQDRKKASDKKHRKQQKVWIKLMQQEMMDKENRLRNDEKLTHDEQMLKKKQHMMYNISRTAFRKNEMIEKQRRIKIEIEKTREQQNSLEQHLQNIKQLVPNYRKLSAISKNFVRLCQPTFSSAAVGERKQSGCQTMTVKENNILKRVCLLLKQMNVHQSPYAQALMKELTHDALVKRNLVVTSSLISTKKT